MGLSNIIGPVMVGPSSSHTAGAVRLAWLARQLLNDEPRRVRFGLHGSFAKTGRGHGTHLALAGGALGYAPDDPRIKNAIDRAREAGVDISFEDIELGDVHPNTVRIELEDSRERHEVIGSSIGGGMVRIWKIDGLDAYLSGETPALLVRHRDTPGVIARVALVLADDEVNIARVISGRTQKGGDALMSLEIDHQLSEAGLSYLHSLSYVHWVKPVPPLPEN